MLIAYKTGSYPSCDYTESYTLCYVIYIHKPHSYMYMLHILTLYSDGDIPSSTIDTIIS